MVPNANRSTQRLTAIAFFAALLLLGSSVPVAVFWLTRPTLADAEDAFNRGEFETASQMIAGVLRRDDSGDAILLAVQVAIAKQDMAGAEQLLKRITADDSSHNVDTLFMCGKLWGSMGHLAEAEHFFRSTIERKPQHIDATNHLLDLLRMEGRNWESREFVANLLVQRRFRLDHLQVLGSVTRSWLNPEKDREFLVFCETVDPQSPLPMLGTVRMMITGAGKDLALAKELLQEYVAMAPHLMEAQILLGQALFESGDDKEYHKWRLALPNAAERHAAIRVLDGRWAHRQHDTPGAIRCLWEAIRRFPNDGAGTVLLAKLLVSVGREEDAEPFQRRGDLLLKLDDLFYRQYTSVESIEARIELLEKLGRDWEAVGWCEILRGIDPDSAIARSVSDRLKSQLDPHGPLTTDAANPALAIDLSEYPLPQFVPTDKPSIVIPSAASTSISFRDDASNVGLEFEYFVDLSRKKEAVYSFDFSGGGVGAVDFDCDGWPDLYMTQSMRHPSSDVLDPPDSLFWNQMGEFVDVAELAGIAKLTDFTGRRFGLGISVGDYNSDGFPDLYVSNIGANTLYLNNGDGTFEDVTASSGAFGDSFSVSSAFADFNGDGLADLFVVNYLGGDALELQCMLDGKRSPCSPLKFPGQADRLYLNLGDGRFRETAREVGVQVTDPGKGMGLLVADFDGQPGLDVYVANDTSANHLYLNRSTTGGEFRLVERGGVSGLAYSSMGRLQGSMGISATDFNRDGMLDIYVTNFLGEANNFFTQIVQSPQAVYSDVALEVNLALPTVPAVGWGTQFLDADLDGDADLFVANGHVDESVPFSEPAQLAMLFENSGARFVAVTGGSEYLRKKLYGRAVARLDWNRDGLEDLCVNHMGAPVALLTNSSTRQGNFVAIELRGVQSSRDAIGAVVEVTVDGETFVQTLMSGDGFSASNQRQLLFGVGQRDQVEQLTIRWPKSEPQTVRDLAVNSSWLIIEGAETPLSN